MPRPGKTMSKNTNCKFTTRNSKQDIFSGFAKASKAKEAVEKRTTEISKPEADNQNA